MKRETRRQFVLGLAGASAAMACKDGGQGPRAPASGAPGSVPAGGAPSGSNAGADDGRASPAPGVPQRTLGKTGVRVSMIGLGGFHIGKMPSESDSIALIRRAIDSGITFMDNCWDYNDGQSEVRMGKALADGYRQRVFLMTKLDGRTRDAARGQLEQSLSRLRTDVIDLVQVHEVIRESDPERCFADGGIIQALIEARQAGKLRFIGFTGHKSPAIHLAMLQAADRHDFAFDTVQMPLNVMDAHYDSFEKNVLPVLLRKNIGVLGMKNMGSGDILASGVVQPEECLRYALSLPTSVVISGMDSDAVLDANLRTARAFQPLRDDEKLALLARTRAPASDGKFEPFKTSHKYDGTVQHPEWLEKA